VVSECDLGRRLHIQVFGRDYQAAFARQSHLGAAVVFAYRGTLEHYPTGMESIMPKQAFTTFFAACALLVLATTVHTGCKSDYQDAIENCHMIYNEPSEADDLAVCIQDAQDEYQSCVND
jgi:hypothetical protein